MCREPALSDVIAGVEMTRYRRWVKANPALAVRLGMKDSFRTLPSSPVEGGHSADGLDVSLGSSPSGWSLWDRSWNARDRPRAVTASASAGFPVSRLNPFAGAGSRAPDPRTRPPRVDCRNVSPPVLARRVQARLQAVARGWRRRKACTLSRGSSAGVPGQLSVP